MLQKFYSEFLVLPYHSGNSVFCDSMQHFECREELPMVLLSCTYNSMSMADPFILDIGANSPVTLVLKFAPLIKISSFCLQQNGYS
jgi:hypothetical protein